jgi:ABC-2 type transport system permease protein
MNIRAITTIIDHEMIRFYRTLGGSILSPVITASLYFVVFGSAIGSQIGQVGEIPYDAFIVPGMLLLSIATQSTSNSAFGIFFQKFTGTDYELLSAPLNNFELVIAFVLAATIKAMLLGSIILIVSFLFVDYTIIHPFAMTLFFFLTCFAFSLFGFILGIWAKSFDQLQIMPNLVLTPLIFLGGSLYSISMLPLFWQKVSLLNPIFYLIDGFRWSFFGVSDLNIWISFGAICGFLIICGFVIAYIFKKGLHLN